ncbi:MAG: GTP cyclohydrolase I FolE, partial [Nitrospiraceae bacterium]
IQERLTIQLAETLQTYLNPAGVGVVIEGRAFCMTRSGMQRGHAVMITSGMRGAPRSKRHTREEFLHLIHSTRIL